MQEIGKREREMKKSGGGAKLKYHVWLFGVHIIVDIIINLISISEMNVV